jgi:TM2 domain-containing membrane protein YozV
MRTATAQHPNPATLLLLLALAALLAGFAWGQPELTNTEGTNIDTAAERQAFREALELWEDDSPAFDSLSIGGSAVWDGATISGDQSFTGNVGITGLLTTANIWIPNASLAGTGKHRFNTPDGDVTNELQGAFALDSHVTGAQYNSAFGHFALESLNNVNADDNSAFGNRAGLDITSGQRNSYFGSGAGDGTLTGSNNTALGYKAGTSIGSGSNNVVIGSNSDIGLLGGGADSSNVVIGASSQAAPFFNSASNAVVIGSGSTGGGDDSIYIGQGIAGASANELIIGTDSGIATGTIWGVTDFPDGIGFSNDSTISGSPTFSGDPDFIGRPALNKISYGSGFLEYNETLGGALHKWEFPAGPFVGMEIDIGSGSGPYVHLNNGNAKFFFGTLSLGQGATPQNGTLRLYTSTGFNGSFNVQAGSGISANRSASFPDGSGILKLQGTHSTVGAVALTADNQALTADNVQNGWVSLTSDDATASNRAHPDFEVG